MFLIILDHCESETKVEKQKCNLSAIHTRNENEILIDTESKEGNEYVKRLCRMLKGSQSEYITLQEYGK